MDNNEYLHDLDINKNNSALEISILTGKTRNQIKRLLRKHGIRKTAIKNSGKKYDDITWLSKQYPDKMFEISNGITLCKKCHEKTYGKETKYINCLVRVVQKMSD
jgi:hypothetical protein